MVPLRVLFIRLGRTQHRRFVKGHPRDLKAYGQAGRSESAWHGDRWQSREVNRAHQAEQRLTCRDLRAQADVGLTAAMCRDQSRRCDQHIDLRPEARGIPAD
jgi:hypothetical protein